MSPSTCSLTRKPKPRVASNHFTRPVTGGISASEDRSSGLHSAWAPLRPTVRTRLPRGPINICPSVGKPTLGQRSVDCSREARRGRPRPPAQARRSRGPGANRARREPSPRSPSRAASGRAALAANGPIRRRWAKRSAAVDRLASACSRALCAVLFANPGDAQLLDQPPLAVTAAGQRPRLRQRESGVIDIAELGEPLGDRLEVRLPRAVPAALADLAREISAQLRPASSRSARHSAARAHSSSLQSSGTAVPARSERVMAPFLCHSRRPSGNRLLRIARRDEFDNQGRDGVLDRNASVTNRACPAGRHPHARHAAAPPRRFRHFRRSAGLCGEGPARAQLPRCPRHAGAGLPLCRAARGRARSTPGASSRLASSRATASRWSPKPAPNSPPASSARSMPAPGRCRCRCRPASAGAKPMSTSSRCS